MRLSETNIECQIPSLRQISESPGKMPSVSYVKQIKILIRRHLSPGKERAFKIATNDYLNRLYRFLGRQAKCTPKEKNLTLNNLKPGDWVRIRSLDQIQGTVNHWNQVKGCAFMPVMAKYCGAVARVFKVMHYFVDECDLHIKKTKGIILLQDIICKGTETYGRCDRNCFHFWREEWLEKIEQPPIVEFTNREKESKKIDFVRVRSESEILNALKKNDSIGNSLFKPQMLKLCGTKQRILKPLNRYLDEHDLTIKTAKGIILLENVICQGLSENANCDRSCHYLWKKEWLEPI